MIAGFLPEPHASLLSGMLFGGSHRLPPDFYRALLSTGTLHVTALSGMNISIIIALIANITMIFGRRLSSALSLLFVVIFIFFVGPSPSVVRAGMMGSLSLIAIILGRQYWALLALFLSGGMMLAVYPGWILETGFQLSFLSTLGIILLSSDDSRTRPSLARGGLARLKKGIADELRITLSAQVFTLPVVILAFHRVSLIAPLTNILIGWTIAPLTVLGFLVCLLGWIYAPLGQTAALFAWPLLEYFIRIIYLTAGFPLASVGQ